MIKKYIVLRFNSVKNGVDFMSSYEYASSFIVKDKIYNKLGNIISLDIYLEFNLEDVRNVITDVDQFTESMICYDGDNLFIEKIS